MDDSAFYGNGVINNVNNRIFTDRNNTPECFNVCANTCRCFSCGSSCGSNQPITPFRQLVRPFAVAAPRTDCTYFANNNNGSGVYTLPIGNQVPATWYRPPLLSLPCPCLSLSLPFPA